MHSDLELSCMCVDALVDTLVVRVDEVLEKFGGVDQVRSTPRPSNTPLGRMTAETSSSSERTSYSSNRT